MSAVIGIAGAIVAHRVFVGTGWFRQVPYQLSVCTAIGIVVGVLLTQNQLLAAQNAYADSYSAALSAAATLALATGEIGSASMEGEPSQQDH